MFRVANWFIGYNAAIPTPAGAILQIGNKSCVKKIYTGEGEVSAVNGCDQAQRSRPPHSLTQNRRLARQTQVLGDITVTQYDGVGGQDTTVAR